MPYSFETHHVKLPRCKDRRVKLTDEQRIEIREAYSRGVSQRAIARAVGVSRRLVSFIVDPEKLRANQDRRAERGGWQQYYEKDLHADSMREHRRYKQSTLRTENNP